VLQRADSEDAIRRLPDVTPVVAARPIRRILIANRGEIAMRVIRACDELGIATVAAASEADQGALHARAAGERVVVGPPAARDSYLRGDRLIALARERGCDAIHPGYGFLSQNPAFAEAVERAGLIFIGPKAPAIRLMGDKAAARRAMAAAGVPIVPGYEGTGDEDDVRLAHEAEGLGFPLLIKAVAGGGGRGMRAVRVADDLGEALRAARREAEKAFGDGRLFLERLIDDARHIEIQVLADGSGDCVHLFERDCSIQRRFQKIVEEAPSPFADADLRQRMGETAVRAARACGYVNAGTVEFLVGVDRSFHFLEMNTRIQVEHPVTEMTTGIDLVKAQIRIAAGERLPFAQTDLASRGSAIECRINAEDPGNDFMPATGRILLADFPGGPGVRVDTGIETGDEVTMHYDPLLAKIIVHAEDRASAIRRMELALGRTALLGVATNLPYLRAILAHPTFRAGAATTAFVGRDMAGWRADREVPEDALLAVAIADALRGGSGDGGRAAGDVGRDGDPWSRADGYRVGGR
jgi:acetyl-CoA carboxylase biotin carboxylase subunit